MAAEPINYRAVLEQLRVDIRERETHEAELKEDLAAVSADLAELRQAVRALTRLAGEVAEEPVARRRWGRHAEAVRKVFVDANRPLRVGEIADRLLAAGHVLPADQRSRDSAIYSAMRRRPGEFARSERGLWALVEAGTNGRSYLTKQEIEEGKRLSEELRRNESKDDWVEFTGDGG